jgi:hypothetical protein
MKFVFELFFFTGAVLDVSGHGPSIGSFAVIGSGQKSSHHGRAG